MRIISRVQKQIYMLVFIVVFWSVTLAIPAPAAQAYSYSFQQFPDNLVGITKPAITLLFDTDMKRSPTHFSMSLNGENVQAVYDNKKGTFEYTPDQDLLPGTYTVRMSISYSGYQPIEHSWTFTVAADAYKQFPAPGTEQIKGLAVINDYREIHQLPSLNLNDQLNAIASAHAKYLDRNKVGQGKGSEANLHLEEKGKPEFVGATPGERSVYYGFLSSIGEDAAYLKGGSITEAIDALFDAPYHRTPFLDPATEEIGIAKAGDYTIIEFGLKSGKSTQLVVSPAAGDRYVPTSFYGHETPDPIRMYPQADYPIGYPMMANYTGQDIETVKLLKSELTNTRTNQPVKVLANDPVNDDSLTASVIMMPIEPLQLDTSYHAKLWLQVVKKDGTSQEDIKEWDFTTEPVEGLGKAILHQHAERYKKSIGTGGTVQRVASFGLEAASYQVDGVDFPMKRQPEMVDGSSFLYVRDLAAALGAQVEWDEQQRAAVYTKGSLKVTLFTEQDQYAMNGERRSTTTPARLIGENTMVPVRLLAEVLGAKVDYDDATRIVKLTY
ncbi:stalk domain-containing protein [Paenibacillus sp. y28]|uniref:stalk domain-containing protein n=1 Tax=Paenibacillus sp. y28 TaxID=3129110 RepID=UPI0030194D1E